jgi:GTP-binding protein Era
MTDTAPITTRAGFAAVLGAPNAGKSTLVNRLVGAKVSIVTQKVQTTRFPVRGVAMEGSSQVVLVDTPGVFAPRRRLDRAMVKAAWTGAHDADAVVHLVDAEGELGAMGGQATPAQHRSAEDTARIVEGLKASGRKVILALNKIDVVKRDTLLGLSDRLFAEGVYDEAFMISAHNGSGVDDLKRRLAELMPEGPWLYPEDQTADLPVRLLAAEITSFEDRPDGGARIEQTIYVEREGQRPIVLGKGGQTLKWIGQKAREDLMEILDRPVHLFLHVKVQSGWADDRSFYRDNGLEFDA